MGNKRGTGLFDIGVFDICDGTDCPEVVIPFVLGDAPLLPDAPRNWSRASDRRGTVDGDAANGNVPTGNSVSVRTVGHESNQTADVGSRLAKFSPGGLLRNMSKSSTSSQSRNESGRQRHKT